MKPPTLGQLAPKGLWVILDPQVCQVRPPTLVPQDHRGQLDPLVILAQLVMQDPQAM